MVSTLVVRDLNVPRFGKHVYLLHVYSLDELKVRVTELEVVQRELYADKVQGQVERREFAVVGRSLCAVDKFAEQSIHEGESLLHLLIVAGLLSHDCCLATLTIVLLAFVICLFCVRHKQLRHVVDNH